MGVTAEQARSRFCSVSFAPHQDECSGANQDQDPASAVGTGRLAQGEGFLCVSGAPDTERRDPQQLGASGPFVFPCY